MAFHMNCVGNSCDTRAILSSATEQLFNRQLYLLSCFNSCHLKVVYVMPSTSGRTQTYPRASDKVPFFLELKALREEVKQKSADTSCSDGQQKY